MSLDQATQWFRQFFELLGKSKVCVRHGMIVLVSNSFVLHGFVILFIEDIAEVRGGEVA